MRTAAEQLSARYDDADKPAAKRWLDVAWRVYESIQKDRVMLIAAGVTYYALLALFPATAALVSLYGLFADASTINDHLALLSGFLPEGALQVIGDQVQSDCRAGARHAWSGFPRHLGFVGVERQRWHQGDLRCPQHHLQGTGGKTQLHRSDAAGIRFHCRRHGVGPPGLGCHCRRPGRTQALGHYRPVRSSSADMAAMATVCIWSSWVGWPVFTGTALTGRSPSGAG